MDHLKTRWQEMDRGRRIVLAVQPALFALFLLVWLTYGRQTVVEYMGTVLRAEAGEETTAYSGRVDGYDVRYVVSPGPVVEFWLDGEMDSVYTVAEDPTAIPQTEDTAEFSPGFLAGVEIRKDGEPWFRGAYSPYSAFWLLDEAGNNLAISFSAAVGEPDLHPTPGAVLRFANGPETAPRGYGPLILLGLFCSALCSFSLLFEDQIFRWNLSFQIRDPYGAEPSDWELFGRWMGWVMFTGMAALFYALGAGLFHISS